MSDDKIDLATEDILAIKKILNQYIPHLEVRAFGSRVNHTAKKFSDLDLVVMTTKPLSLSLLSDLTEAFSESLLPIKIDLLDWSRISEDFQKIILKKNIRFN